MTDRRPITGHLERADARAAVCRAAAREGQAGLAKRAKVSRQYVNKVVAGDVFPGDLLLAAVNLMRVEVFVPIRKEKPPEERPSEG